MADRNGVSVSEPGRRYSDIARRAWVFSAWYWGVCVVVLSMIAVISESAGWSLLPFGIGLAVVFISYLLSFGIMWGRVGSAWFAEAFDSNLQNALEVIDVAYLRELGGKKPRVLSLALQARFPALGGTTLTDKLLPVLASGEGVGPSAGTRTDAVVPRSDAGGLVEWAERHDLAGITRLRILLTVAGYGLAAVGVVLMIIIALLMDSRVGGVAFAVALPFMVAGVIALFVRNSSVTPAVGVVTYRQKFASSPERLLDESAGKLPAELAAVTPAGPILGAVTALRRLYPWLPLWDAVAVVRTAQSRL